MTGVPQTAASAMLNLLNPFSASAESPVAPVDVQGVWGLCHFPKEAAQQEDIVHLMTSFASNCQPMAVLSAQDCHGRSAASVTNQAAWRAIGVPWMQKMLALSTHHIIQNKSSLFSPGRPLEQNETKNEKPRQRRGALVIK